MRKDNVLKLLPNEDILLTAEREHKEKRKTDGEGINCYGDGQDF